ncbi:(Fe-S)-binding protein [Desulfospira joergensenii]|uniref:(Fe-S)-binding protein n=1 Tax=Desulfospira joergensenii TaxID=53329 RepID=UPI0004083A4D|nr:(Fe-S)-binding protein [Desulfospira joergensenii]
MSDKNQIQNCGKCGLCLSACPVYKTLKEEHLSPRAKLQLIKKFEGRDIHVSPLLKELVSKCLMCGSCTAACPSGVDHYGQFMEMRRKMMDEVGEIPAIRSMIFMLAREYRIQLGAKMARIGRKITPDQIARSLKLGSIPVHSFPGLNPVPFRKGLPEKIEPRGKVRESLIYFTGCATNYLFEDTGRAVIGILTHLGYRVIIPKTQTCCGIPLMFHGAPEEAAANMAANIKAIQGAMDIHNCTGVIVDCTTCGTALRDEYLGLARKIDSGEIPAPKAWKGFDPQTLGRSLNNIASKTRDILSFVHEHRVECSFDPGFSPVRATYHAPCHSRNSFKTGSITDRLFREFPCFDFVPAPDQDECCGGGGTFFYEFPDISRQMAEKKINTVKSLEVPYWLTDCPVCRINLAGSLGENRDGPKVIHPVVPIYDQLIIEE